MPILCILLALQLAPAAGPPKKPSAARQVAAQPAAGNPTAATPTAAPPAPTRPAVPDELDLLPAEKPQDPAELAAARVLDEKLAERRLLLRVHQVTGIALLATMGAAVVLGQLQYADKYGGGHDTGKWHAPHQIVSYGAAGLFAAAGILALVAPQPFERQKRIDTAVLHKTAMAIATAGMVAQVVLGIATAHSEGSLSQRDLARAHQIIGYTTFAATATGFTVLLF